MKIVCLITDEQHPGFINWLEPSCMHHDLELQVINYGDKYPSHKMKDFLLLEYIKRSGKNEILLFTDAYDTMFLADEQEIMNKFRSFQSPLVFSAEINCWPDTRLGKQYPAGTEKQFFKYLNSGGFVGESQYIRELIEKYYEGEKIDHSVYKWSNQYTWNQIYLKEQSNIRLDHTGEIFYTLSSDIAISSTYSYHSEATVKAQALEEDKKRILEEILFENNRLLSRVTQTSPCHLHFSSPTTKYLMQTDFFDQLREWEIVSNEK
jgi:hypothetical protein